MFTSQEVAARLDRATEDRRLLDHPFYKAWAAGKLTTEDLGFYSTQYWRQVESFPSYLGTLAERLPGGPASEIVRENLSDEVDGDHQGMWLTFAGGVGVASDDVRSSEAVTETQECVERFTDGTSTRSPLFGLGMIYGYESQTPDVARTKVEGLRDHYDVTGPAAEYFELHAEMDVEHSAELAEA